MQAPKLVNYKGQDMTVSEAMRLSGSVLTQTTVYGRLGRGWPLLRALMRTAESRRAFGWINKGLGE